MRRGDAYGILFRLVNEKQRQLRVKKRDTIAAGHRGKYAKKIEQLEELRNFLAGDPAFKAAGTGFTPETADALLQEIARYEGPA